MRTDQIVIQPIITEKSLKEAKTASRYSFLVAKEADKTEIKYALKKLYNVDAIEVTTTTIKGSKTIVSRFTRKVKPYAYKKARVKIAKDQKIDMFEEALKE